MVMRESITVSERRACLRVGLSRTVLHYESKVQPESEQLRIYRLYSNAGLSVRRRKKRHGVAVERHALELPPYNREAALSRALPTSRTSCLRQSPENTDSTFRRGEHEVSGLATLIGRPRESPDAHALPDKNQWTSRHTTERTHTEP